MIKGIDLINKLCYIKEHSPSRQNIRGGTAQPSFDWVSLFNFTCCKATLKDYSLIEG
jgi:hypothetical protein